MRACTSSSRCGSAVVGVMVLTLVTAGVSFALLSYASHSLDLTRRSLEYQRTRAAAEAGLDYGVNQLRGTMRTFQFSLKEKPLQDYLDALSPPPAFDDATYTTPNGNLAFRIKVDTKVQTGTITNGFSAVGANGTFQQFTITCGARHTGSGASAVMKQQVQAFSVHINRFGVFYEDDLEIDPGPQMQFYGPVHANGDLYVDGPIDFYDRITARGNIYHRRKDNGSTVGGVYIENGAAQLVNMGDGFAPIDSDHEDWMTTSLTRWDGNVLDRAHAVPYLTPPYNPLSDAHELIERPLPTGHADYISDTEAAKLANNAALILHVDVAGNLTATDYFGSNLAGVFSSTTVLMLTNVTYLATSEEADDDDDVTYTPVSAITETKSDGVYTLTDPGAFDTTKVFYDDRENAKVVPVDIYIDELMAVFPQIATGTTYGVTQGRGVVYVTRDDPDGTGGGLPAVRLRHGAELPDGGLTFVSDLPIYVEGDYNVLNGVKPAMIAGDSVTLLSNNWRDYNSGSSLSERPAVDTTYNAVIMTGNSPTTPGVQYSGGLENVLRFLEDWSGRTVAYRGSIVDLWFSEISTSVWDQVYYSPAYRDWGYDPLYRSASPPGAPRVFAVEQLRWSESTFAAESW